MIDIVGRGYKYIQITSNNISHLHLQPISSDFPSKSLFAKDTGFRCMYRKPGKRPTNLSRLKQNKGWLKLLRPSAEINGSKAVLFKCHTRKRNISLRPTYSLMFHMFRKAALRHTKVAASTSPPKTLPGIKKVNHVKPTMTPFPISKKLMRSDVVFSFELFWRTTICFN